jgi:transcriptional regulator with XRE-family HTH domain
MEGKRLTMNFGIVVRRLRAEKGFSQEGFADICGLHRTYVGSIERYQGKGCAPPLRSV